MTTRRTRKPAAAKAVEPTRGEDYKIPQQELENFFTDPKPADEVKEEPVPVVKKRVRPPKTGKVFLGKEEMQEWDNYVSWLKNEQGLKEIKHKKI